MEPIKCKNAYYVKLGRNGMWEESSIKKSILRIGWTHQTLPNLNNGRWSVIQKQLEKEISDKGTPPVIAVRFGCSVNPQPRTFGSLSMVAASGGAELVRPEYLKIKRQSIVMLIAGVQKIFLGHHY
jgi:hypothetical protein